MPAVSWKRAFKHAAVPVAVVIVAGAVFVSTAKVADPEKLGEATGKLVAGVLALALGVSYLAQTGRRIAAWTIGIGVPALLAGSVIVALAVTGAPLPPLSAADRAPLVRETIAGEPRVRHPTLGFSFHDPGPDFVAVDASQLGQNASSPLRQYYPFHRDTDVVLVAMTRGAPASRADFVDFVAGTIAGMTSSAPGGAMRTTRDDVTWTDGRGIARVELGNATIQIAVGVYTVRPVGSAPVVVALLVPGDGSFADLLASFKPD